MPLHLTLVGDRFTWRDEHLELQRLVAFGPDLDAVAAGIDAQSLEHAVELSTSPTK